MPVCTIRFGIVAVRPNDSTSWTDLWWSTRT